MLRRIRSAALVVGLVAVGVTVAPTIRYTTVENYRVDREELRFRPVAANAAIQQPEVAIPADPTLSEVVDADPFVTIGVSFAESPTEPVSVRWQDDGGWSDWRELEIEVDKGPDRETEEGRRAAAQQSRAVTQPLWVGEATAYQVLLSEADAAAAPEAVLVRPDGRDLVVETDPVPAGAQSVGKPPIHPRSDWSARAPANSIESASALKLAVVHHSATGNDYARGDVPGIIRSIQAFHMDSNGWSDIGYNFVVDRFGGVWEGRDGSTDRNSIGAHAEGFNTGSVGVVALGNSSTATSTNVQVNAVTDVIAWRFALMGVDPATNVAFTSGGSSTVPAGTTLNLPRVIGHRDVGSTDCPGSSLYSALAARIRPALPVLVASKLSPIGVVQGVSAGPGSVLVSGWAFDPLYEGKIEVHAYVDGVGRNLGPAALHSPGVDQAYPGVGDFHGYYVGMDNIGPGPHQVCLFAINTGPGTNVLLGCFDVVVPSGPPIGAIDRLEATPDGVISLSGWMLDPDTAASIETHVYVDGRGINLGPTAMDRGDIGGAFPAYGTRHGYAWSSGGFAPGNHSVCVYGINVGAGSNVLFGCRTVRVPGGPPVGIVDHITAGPDGVISLSGWALDPDTAGSIETHVYVDGRGVNLGPTSGDRGDIAAAFPGYGARHGFSWSTGGMSPGAHDVCVFAIGVGSGGNALLRCQRVYVPGGSPLGVLDTVYVGGDRIGVRGWVIDPDTAAPIETHVYVGSNGMNAGPANVDRPDLAPLIPAWGSRHGFDWLTPPMPRGNHNVCVYAINVGQGGHRLLGCRVVGV